MPSTGHPCPRRGTTSVLVAVAVMSGGIVLLGNRFDAAPSHAVTPSPRLSPRLSPQLAACVAEEDIRLINPDREQCRADEVELAPRSAGCGLCGRALKAEGP